MKTPASSVSHQYASEPSLVDRWSGQYTNSFIVAALFIITIISFIIYLCIFKSKLSDVVTTGFISLLSGLGGFFVASLKQTGN